MSGRPQSLTVVAHLSCQRWQAMCGDVHVHDFRTQRCAVISAAAEGWAAVLKRPVPLQQVGIIGTEQPDTFITKLKPAS